MCLLKRTKLFESCPPEIFLSHLPPSKVHCLPREKYNAEAVLVDNQCKQYDMVAGGPAFGKMSTPVPDLSMRISPQNNSMQL